MSGRITPGTIKALRRFGYRPHVWRPLKRLANRWLRRQGRAECRGATAA